jgi:hypothetical protein
VDVDEYLAVFAEKSGETYRIGCALSFAPIPKVLRPFRAKKGLEFRRGPEVVPEGGTATH